jgi:hypothetical protein
MTQIKKIGKQMLQSRNLFITCFWLVNIYLHFLLSWGQQFPVGVSPTKCLVALKLSEACVVKQAVLNYSATKVLVRFYELATAGLLQS